MKTHAVTQRFMIIGKTNLLGQQSFRILDTDSFEFEPRIYGYYPSQECRELNANRDAINAEIVYGPTSEESRTE